MATAHAERVWGWLLMGGTLTKELVVCAGVSTCAGLLLVLRGVVVGGCGGTSPGGCRVRRAHCWVLRSPATWWWCLVRVGPWIANRSPVGG